MMELRTKVRLFFGLLACGLLLNSAVQLNAQLPATPPPVTTATLTVHVTGLQSAKGKVQLTLFRDSNETPVDVRKVEIDAKALTATCVFNNIPQGTYTVRLMHDDNESGKMEYDNAGVPLKGYGMSNNPPKQPRKPDFDETNFKLDKPEKSIEISVLYW